jgi:sugar fermentation stimulation protein A
VRYGAASRVDFLLQSDEGPPCWLEVKSVTLSRTAGLAEFPDCRTERGAKHLAELSAMADEGHAAAVLFVVQRNDCNQFAVAGDLDPAFATALAHAQDRGVLVMAYGCDISPTAITLNHRLA